jgi:hypothetical protein
MNAIHPLSVNRRIKRRWAERLLRQVRCQLVLATERMLQLVSNIDGSLVFVPVKAVVDRQSLDQSRSRD